MKLCWAMRHTCKGGITSFCNALDAVGRQDPAFMGVVPAELDDNVFGDAYRHYASTFVDLGEPSIEGFNTGVKGACEPGCEPDRGAYFLAIGIIRVLLS